MSAVAAPADRRFRRAHVKPARRRGRLARARAARCCRYVRARARWLAYGAVPRRRAASRRPRVLQSRSHRRPRQRAAVERRGAGGAQRAARREPRAGPISTRWRQRLLASPWVRDAALRRSLPSTVEVVVSGARSRSASAGIERRAVPRRRARRRSSIEYGPQYADLDLPIVDGLAGAHGDRAR